MIVGLLLPLLVSSWDGEGHRIVARVAAYVVAKKTRRFIRDHLDPKAGSSTWADSVVNDLPWSADFHFSHTPYQACSTFDMARDCANQRCLVTAIANYTLRAGDVGLDAAERSEALKFLIHFVADAHQPLHTGFAVDAGGNLIHLLAPPTMSLHEAWDTLLIDAVKRSQDTDQSWYGVASSIISRLSADQNVVDSYRMLSGHEIVSETVLKHTCTAAYRDEDGIWIPRDGYSLSDQYISTRASIVFDQLTRAGVRLAHILDSAAATFYAAEQQREVEAHISSTQFASENPFSDLAIGVEFDPEELVFEVPDDCSDDEKSVVESSTTMAPPRLNNPSKKMKKKKKDTNLTYGIDLGSLVLIKRNRRFIVTYRQLVTSNDFIPSTVQPVYARLTSMKASDPPMMFLFDTCVLDVATMTAPLQPVLTMVFGKLAGKASQQVVSSYVEPPVPIATVRAAQEMESVVLGLMNQFGLLPPTVTDPGSFEEIRNAVWQPGNPTFVSQENRLIVIKVGKFAVVSHHHLFRDSANRRWIFNRFKVMTTVLDAVFTLFVDARIWDGPLTREVRNLIEAAPRKDLHNRLLKDIIERGCPILERLLVTSAAALAPGPEGDTVRAQMLAAFATKRHIERPESPDLHTMEYVLRSPEEEAQVLTRYGVRSIMRLEPHHFFGPTARP